VVNQHMSALKFFYHMFDLLWYLIARGTSPAKWEKSVGDVIKYIMISKSMSFELLVRNFCIDISSFYLLSPWLFNTFFCWSRNEYSFYVPLFFLMDCLWWPGLFTSDPQRNLFQIWLWTAKKHDRVRQVQTTKVRP